ncbi:MAG: hypothetical protein ABW040_01830, partial [Microbacteriaceae bacterium]
MANRRAWGDADASYFTRFARGLAMTLAVVVASFGLAVVPTGSAEAVVVQWGTSGGTAPNYEVDVNGDFAMAGNGVLACDSIGNQAGYGTCAQLHGPTSPTGNQNANVNDAFRMVNSNTVAGFTTNSSSATMTVPSGATVVKAFLTWSANTGTFQGQTAPYCSATGFGPTTLPAGSATGYTSRAVQLKVGAGAIQSFAPASVLQDATTQATARYYSASADVTSAFENVATGSPVTLSAGNIWAPQGPGCYAGWSVTAIYDFGTYVPAQAAASAPKTVIWYEGHVRQGASDAALTVDYTGFTAVGPGTRVGFTMFEGDRDLTGDTASYRPGSSGTFTEIPNATGATGNIGIGRALGQVRYTQTGANDTFTNQSVDVFTSGLSRVVAGTQRVQLQLGTSGDSYLLANSVLSVPTAGLKVEKTLDGTQDTQYRVAGEVATFTIRLTNVGAGTLRNIVVADDQANCARTLTGITLASGASTTFTCTAAAGTTANYTSTASATARTVDGDYLAQGSDSTAVVLSAIGLTKTSAYAAGGTGRAGDVVTYTFTATNTGGGTLTGVAITDPLSGLSALTYAWPGTAGTLTAGQSVTATANYTLRQTDVDAGSVQNTARVVGTDADGGPQPAATANRTQPVTPAGALTVTKSGALASGATGVVGDRINYSFRITNSGNVTMSNVALADRLEGISAITYGAWPTPASPRVLAPGQSVTATAFYAIRQADVDAGVVRNLATASGTTPAGASVTGASPEVQVGTIAAAPALVTTKSASPSSGARVGDTITYTITARNSGNTTLTNVAVADPLEGLTVTSTQWPAGQTAGTLAPGQQVVVTATYVVRQANVDAGAVNNQATTTARTPAGATLTAASPQVSTPTAAAAPAVSILKRGTLAEGAAGRAGDVVTYTFTVANPGNVTLRNVAITDPMTGTGLSTPTVPANGWPSGTAGTLRPGDQVIATATYTLKQSDVNAGSVVNRATVSAAPPTGANVSAGSTSTLPITRSGAITVEKTGAPTVVGQNALGNEVTFSFLIRNTGNVTLDQVALTDSLPGLSTPVLQWGANTPNVLAPNQEVRGTATYTIRQSDIDRGSVLNTATVTGRTPSSQTVTGTSPEATVPTVTRAPDLSLVKSGQIAGGAAGNAGDVVTYSFVVRNPGNVTLTGVQITDPMTGSGLSTPTVPANAWQSGTVGTLRPGDSVTATASYTIKQSDVNAGSIQNTASVAASTTYGQSLTRSSSTTTNTVERRGAVALTQTGALPSGSTGVAGDIITWSFRATNTGTVTLTGVNSIQPQLAGVSAVTYGTWPDGGTVGQLQPGQSVTGTATYVVTQADVDAGSVIDPAFVTGRTPMATTVRADQPATVPLVPRGALTVQKTGALPANAAGAVGDVVTYSFLLRNTGNVTLNGVTVADPLAGLSTPTAPASAWTDGVQGRLAPGATVTATATYPLTQADVDRGFVSNTATARGTAPGGAGVDAPASTARVQTVAAAPGLQTTKTGTYTSGSGAVGSQITFTVTGRNSGNVTLTGVDVVDSLEGFTVTGTTWSSGGQPIPAGTLTPGATVTVVGTYTVTQANVDAGSVVNTGTTRGTFNATPVQSAATATVGTAQRTPNATLQKQATPVFAGSSPAVGDRIDYRFTLTNTGNVTLTDAAITDPIPGLQDFAYVGTSRTIAPQGQLVATGSYLITQADIDSGAVVNTASSTAQPVGGGAAVNRTGTATVPLAQAGAFTFTKDAAYLTGSGELGSIARYTFRAVNTGNATLTGVAVTDPHPGLGTITYSGWQTAGTLRAGEAVTAVADYPVTQADLNAGTISNTATVSGRTPNGTPTSTTASQSIATAERTATAAVAKTAVVSGSGSVGDRITYTITARNTGNTTLTGVTVTDPMFTASQLSYGAWPSGQTGTLQPTQAIVVTAVKTITQADVDAGTVVNTAGVTADSPLGAPVTASSGAVSTDVVAADAVVGIIHVGALPAGSSGRAGETVTFTFTVSNDGNQVLTGTDVV